MPTDGGPIDDPRGSTGPGTQNEVFLNSQVWSIRKLLVDDTDPVMGSIARVLDLDCLAIDLDLSAITAVNASEDFYSC